MSRYRRMALTVLVLVGLLVATRPVPAGQGGHRGIAPHGFPGWGPRGFGGPRHFGYYGVGFGFYPYGYYGYPYGYYGYPYPYGYGPPYGVAPPGGVPVAAPVPLSGPPDNRCHIHVQLPPDATLWVGGEQASNTGPVRDFVSPEVQPGQAYAYTLRARWTQGGQVVEQTRQATLHPNQTVIVNFGASPPQ